MTIEQLENAVQSLTDLMEDPEEGDRQRNICDIAAFEETRHQLMRNASGWGRDYEAYEQAGLLKIIASYPESCGLEDHLIAIKQAIDDFRPNRVAVDSLSALERVSTVKGCREFVVSLTSFIKDAEIAERWVAHWSAARRDHAGAL